MWWLAGFATLVLFCFSFVLLVGAPYLPTMRKQTQTALDLLALQPGQRLLELGCGDGTVLLAAARRGIRCTGYELNPLLAALCWLRTRKYRALVTVVWGDYWQQNWPPTDAIYAFLLPRLMPKLDKKIIHSCQAPVRLASFAFKVPGRRAAKSSRGIYIYDYK